jgi:tripartite-type tricarboxylate transporter receptor subunit TctC
MALARKPQPGSLAARHRRNALKTLLCTALAATGLAAGPAHAQDWPSKPIKIIVPYTPGGSTDIVTRIVVESSARA